MPTNPPARRNRPFSLKQPAAKVKLRRFVSESALPTGPSARGSLSARDDVDARLSFDVDARLTPRQKALVGVADKTPKPPAAPWLKRTESARELAPAARKRSAHGAGLETDLTRSERTVWVGGIPSLCATNNAVRFEMAKLGEVLSVHVRAKEGISKNWALVMFKTNVHATMALNPQTRLNHGAIVTREWRCEPVAPEKLKSMEVSTQAICSCLCPSRPFLKDCGVITGPVYSHRCAVGCVRSREHTIACPAPTN